MGDSQLRRDVLQVFCNNGYEVADVNDMVSAMSGLLEQFPVSIGIRLGLTPLPATVEHMDKLNLASGVYARLFAEFEDEDRSAMDLVILPIQKHDDWSWLTGLLLELYHVLGQHSKLVLL